MSSTVNGVNDPAGSNTMDDVLIEDDNEDLFVSTYENQPMGRSTLLLSTQQSNTSSSSNSQNVEVNSGSSKPKIEDLMNTIDLNEDSGDIVKPTSLVNNDNVASIPSLGTTSSSQFNDVNIGASLPPSSTATTNIKQFESFDSVPGGGDNLEVVTSSSAALSSSKQLTPQGSNTSSLISITVAEPHKIGDGIGSYMVFTVNTKTTLPYFRRQSLSVNRRFSDFLGLHDKLLEKHAHLGRIVPPPPAKNAVGTAKIKMGKSGQDDPSSSEFLEKRRTALERYLQRNAEHPVICADPDFREFLELDTDLPRSTSTSALSGAGMKRLFSFVGDTVNKITFRMDESDPWYESKQIQIESLDTQLRKLYTSVESLIHHRKELTTATGQLAKSTAILGNCEEHNSLSCALSQLAATHEKVEKIYERQSNNDFHYLSELLKDYIGLIGSVREVFHERVKIFQNLTTLEQNLNRKRETKARMELSQKMDKVPQLEEEIRDIESKLEKTKEDFENISTTIKQEFERFEINRIRDFKSNFVRYMESLLETQESLVDCWEAFLPEGKSITAQ